MFILDLEVLYNGIFKISLNIGQFFINYIFLKEEAGMKLKKGIAFFLTAVMTAGLFSSCGQSVSTASQTGAQSTAGSQNIRVTKEPTPEPTKQVTPEATKEPSHTPEPTPEYSDEFEKSAGELLDKIESMRSAGADTADALYAVNATAGGVWGWDEEQQEADPDTYAYAYQEVLDEGDIQDDVLTDLRQDLADTLSEVRSASPETSEGKAIKKKMQTVLDKMDAAAADMEEVISFFRDQSDLQDDLSNASDALEDVETVDEYQSGLEQMYSILLKLQSDFRELKRPDAMNSIFSKYTDTISAFAQSIYYLYYGIGDSGSVLLRYNGNELISWNTIVLTKYEVMMFDEMAHIYNHYSKLFSDFLDEDVRDLENSIEDWSEPDNSSANDLMLVYDMIDEIYPNQYSNLDSVINLTAGAFEEGRDIMITAEVVGFTQKYEQKVTLGLQSQNIMIKPAILIDLPDLSTQRNTQLKFTITDENTGRTLVQETKNIKIYSIYDFFTYNDEFGEAALFDLLGWMRPESDAVELVRRQAISYLEAYFGSSNAMLPGYQGAYGYEAGSVYITAIQVAAIQKAISDLGVRYNMDVYSFSEAQRVLTADQVVAKKSGICIETSVLMASVLQSAGLHPMIILIPGHAQVAVETWEESGSYLLVETTTLPYDGIDVSSGELDFGYLFDYSVQSEEEWRDYLEYNEETAEYYGGIVYVIDCDLRTLLHKSGLENIQATITTEGVKYNVDNTSSDSSSSGASSGSSSSGTQSTDTGSSSEPGYIVVADDTQNYSFLVYDTVSGYIDNDGTAVIYANGDDDYPAMEVSRLYTESGAQEVLDRVAENLQSQGLMDETPELQLLDYTGLTVYGMFVTLSNGEQTQPHIYMAMDVDSESVMFLDAYAADADDFEDIYDDIDLAVASFVGDYTAYGYY